MQAEAVLNGPRAEARAASPESATARASDYELAQRAAAGDMQAF